MKCLKNQQTKESRWVNYNIPGDVKVCRALDEMFEESTNRGIQLGIKQGIERGEKIHKSKSRLRCL